jgi:hypothetical protein
MLAFGDSERYAYTPTWKPYVTFPVSWCERPDLNRRPSSYALFVCVCAHHWTTHIGTDARALKAGNKLPLYFFLLVRATTGMILLVLRW